MRAGIILLGLVLLLIAACCSADAGNENILVDDNLERNAQ